MFHARPTAMVGLLLCLGLTGCGSGSTSATAPSSSAPAPATPPASSAAGPSASAPASPTSPSPSLSAAHTKAELRRALLSLKDVPAGFEVVDSGDSEDGGAEVASSRPGCRALVRLLNDPRPPGSRAQASRSFVGGPEGPFLEESLDAFDSAGAAQAFLDGVRDAVRSCRSVTITVPGTGKGEADVREISFAELGDGTIAARFTGRGQLEGFELVQVGARSGDVVVGLSAVAADPADAEAATEDAVAKVERVLGTSGRA